MNMPLQNNRLQNNRLQTTHPHRQIARCATAVLAALLGTNAWAATVFQENFDSDPLGPLDANWTVTSAGASTVGVVDSTDHGHVMRMFGSPTLGHYLIASRAFSSSALEIGTRADIRPSSGASFLWILNGAGTSIGRRRIRLQLPPGSTVLEAQTVPSGTTRCGTLTRGVWSQVTLMVNASARRFDVLINGRPTACTSIAADIQPPFRSVSVMDASNEGWGGAVRFDNIQVATP
ncbi:MAG TPA: hypothetical protein VGQ93_01890 [Lysobacter sp.]|jgi:hypothetical protein|nr:hypothetical protein [Lysobacter sp.]